MKTITKLTMTIIVVLIMTVGVLIPITSGLEDNIKSVEQNTDYRFVVKNNNLNLSVECDSVGQYTINGREFTGNNYSAIIGDDLFINLTPNNFSVTDLENNIYYVVTTAGAVVNIENGEYTHTYNGTTYTGTVETLLYPSHNGDYGAYWNPTASVNADKEDPIYLVSNKASPEPKFILVLENGVENRNAALMEPISINPIADYDGDVTASFQATSNEDGLSWNYTNFSVTSETSTYTPTIYAPIKYHVVDSSAETVRAIVNVLPIIILIGLMVTAGYAVMSSFRGRSEL